MIITSVLLVMNILLVWKLRSASADHPRPPHMHRPGGPKNIIIERLELDESQVAAYEAQIEDHREQIRQQERQIAALKGKLYSILGTQQEARKNALLEDISKVQAEIESIHYAHFEDIRSLCRDDQLASFELLSQDLAELFLPPHLHSKP